MDSSVPVKSLSDRAGLLIVANLFKYSIGFVLPMVLVRLLSQNDYGTYQQLLLIGSTAIGIMTIGLPTSVYYFYHHVTKERQPTLVVQTTFMLVISGAVAAALIFFGAGMIADSLNNASLIDPLKIYAISIAFMVASEHSLAFMIAQNRYVLAVKFEIAETVVRVVVLLAPLWLGYGLRELVAGILLYAALRFAVRTLVLFSRNSMSFQGWSKSFFPVQQLEYSIPLALVSLTGLISMAFNRGILASAFSPVEFAIYAVGALEIPLDTIFQTSVANVLRASLPPLVRDGNYEEVVRLLREAVRKLSIIVLPSFVFLFGHAEQFITLLFTLQYSESVPVFRIYLWLMPLTMFILSPVPQAFGKTRANLYINLSVMTFVIIFSYLLLKIIGFYGPAFAIVASQYLGTILFIWLVLKLTRTTLSQLLPLRHMLLVVLVSLVSLIASQLADQLSGSRFISLLLAGIIFSTVFLSLAVVTRVFNEQDRLLIRRWVATLLHIKAS